MSDRLDDIKRRMGSASPGPWIYADIDSVGGGSVYDLTTRVASVRWDPQPRISGGRRVTEREGDANGEFIAHARDDVPWLLAEVERQRTEIARLRSELTDHIFKIERLERAVQAVRELHRPWLWTGDEPTNCSCGRKVPCDTISALDGDLGGER